MEHEKYLGQTFFRKLCNHPSDKQYFDLGGLKNIKNAVRSVMNRAFFTRNHLAQTPAIVFAYEGQLRRYSLAGN